MYEFSNQKPLYLQLKELIEEAILNEVLKAEEMIPSIRIMSRDYRINPLTVSNAVDTLVETGILYKKRGIGMFVSENGKQLLKEQQSDDFKNNELNSAISKAKLLGIEKNEVDNIVKNIYTTTVNTNTKKGGH